jgi:hypothetical protein
MHTMTPPFWEGCAKAGTVQIDTLSFLPTEAKATGRTLDCSTLRGIHILGPDRGNNDQSKAEY